MRELSGRAGALKVSITQGQARLEELNTKLNALGLETPAARPKSSHNIPAIKERLRLRKAQLASAGNAPTAAPSSQQSEQVQLASAGDTSTTSNQVTGTDSTASAVETTTETPEPRKDDGDTEMADSGKLVDVDRSYAAMLADPSQRSKHAPSGTHQPDWNPRTPGLEDATPRMPNGCLLYWLDRMCPTEIEGRDDECTDSHE
jgi:hypothetical protein